MTDSPTVRPMGEGDLEAGLRLAAAAGWNQRLDDWRLALGLGPGFAAFDAGRLAGTTVAVNYGNRVSWIAMVLVDPALRRRGIATRLMRTALDSLAGCGVIKLDATPAGREVYLRLGFEEESVLTRFQCAAVAPRPAPPPGNLRVRPLEPADLPAAAALDALAFGTDRGPFLSRLAPLAPDYGWVAEGPGGLEGFCMGRHGMRWEFLGPVTARGEAAAVALAEAAFSRMEGKPALVDVPEGAGAFRDWLKGRGFEEQRPFFRMRKGPDAFPGEGRLVFGIAGPEFG